MTQLVKCDTRINMFYEKKEKTPDEKLAIAKIQVMMEDAFGILSNSESNPALQSKFLTAFASSPNRDEVGLYWIPQDKSVWRCKIFERTALHAT